MSRQSSRDDAARRGGFITLKSDKETVDFVALTEPEPVEVEGFHRGSSTIVYRMEATPIPLRDDSPAMHLDMSRKAFNAYDEKVPEEADRASVVRMVRYGKPGDSGTTYNFRVVRDITGDERRIVMDILRDLKLDVKPTAVEGKAQAGAPVVEDLPVPDVDETLF